MPALRDAGLKALPHAVEWRRLELRDIPDLADFAPPEWRMALDAVLLQHIGRDYFLGRVATTASGVVAVGQGIVTGRTGWVGNIIVRPDSRRQGLGSRMTRELIDALRGRGCSSLLLIATASGESVYRKIGFRRTSEYVFLDVPRLPPREDAAIRHLGPADSRQVLSLDLRATGESRADLLAPHLASAWGHEGPEGVLDGFFLPSLGGGLVVAESGRAGEALLCFKHAHAPGPAVVPAGNTAALRLLLGQGAREAARAPRMVLGEDAEWRPEHVFARASGYCG